MSQNCSKPPRTIGIALAIILTTLLYTVAPLGFVGFTYTLQSRMRANAVIVGTGTLDLPGGTVGFSSVSAFELGAWSGLALIFLLIAILAWRGNGGHIRYIFMAAIVLMPTLYGGLWAYRRYSDAQSLAASGAMVSGSGTPIICSTTLIFPLFLTLYVVWYMSRGPARAFYRGYYLSRDETSQN